MSSSIFCWHWTRKWTGTLNIQLNRTHMDLWTLFINAFVHDSSIQLLIGDFLRISDLIYLPKTYFKSILSLLIRQLTTMCVGWIRIIYRANEHEPNIEQQWTTSGFVVLVNRYLETGAFSGFFLLNWGIASHEFAHWSKLSICPLFDHSSGRNIRFFSAFPTSKLLIFMMRWCVEAQTLHSLWPKGRWSIWFLNFR